MKKFNKKFLFLPVMCLVLMFSLTGCHSDKYEYITIQPSQTAFLIPLTGKTSAQGKFSSEKLLEEYKVATKEVKITKVWKSSGAGMFDFGGDYRPSHSLIIVERKPETREWTENSGTGTSTKNEGITAESKESIAFMAQMNCSAQIDETDAVRFLYRYNNKPLSEIMDSEIRARIESEFVEQCAKRTLDQILVDKEQIMLTLRKNVIPYFKDRGINITVIGLKGEFSYINQEIQKSIDEKFKSAQEVITQKNENLKILSKAKADAEAIHIQASTIQDQIKMKELDNQSKAIDKWNGVMPQVSGSNGNIFNIPLK